MVKVKFIERMYIGKRIRDIAYHTKKEIFFIGFFFESNNWK